MTINQLRYFIALARQEHMSQTAELLNLSEAALSKSIRSLEKELGTALFDRKGRSIVLNRNGRDFLENAVRIIREVEAGQQKLRQLRYDYRGSISISCFAFPDGIMDCVTDYMKLNPEVQVILTQSLLSPERNPETADFFLNGYMKESTDQNWVSAPLYQEDFYLLVSPRYRVFSQETTAIDPFELKDDCFIGDYIVSDIFTYEESLTRICRNAGFQPKIRARCTDFTAKIRLIDEGLGIGILPRSCLKMARQLSPDTRIFRILGQSTQRTVYLMRKKEDVLSEAAMDFWNFALNFPFEDFSQPVTKR